MSPFGWHRHVLAQLTGNGERTAFVFRGVVFESQPYWRTAIDHNWRRLLAYGGLETPRHPVLGVVASGSCALGELPWVELAELS